MFNIFYFTEGKKFNKILSSDEDEIKLFNYDDFKQQYNSLLQIKKIYNSNGGLTNEDFENKNKKYVKLLENLDNEYTVEELFFYCVLQKNPVVEKDFNNLLKYWTNIYLDLFSTIYKKEHK